MTVACVDFPCQAWQYLLMGIFVLATGIAILLKERMLGRKE